MRVVQHGRCSTPDDFAAVVQNSCIVRAEQALDAYRAAIKSRPGFGEVYWSMANLKIFRFEDAEVDAMAQQLERDDLEEETVIHFHFALAKAFEDRKN